MSKKVVKSEYHYYPFGMEQSGVWQSKPRRDNKYRYNGKELVNDLGLGMYLYGARVYLPRLNIFPSPDPIAEDFPWIDPYAYVFNNPIIYIDPDGRNPIKGLKVLGKTIVRSIKKGKIDGSALVEMGMDAKAIVSPSSTIGERIEGAFNLLSPVSTKDFKALKKFGGKKSTESVTSKEAFRKAKDQNGIPRSQQPDKTIKPNTPEGDAAGLDSRNVRQHEFTNSQGEKVTIRQDKPAKYNEGGKGDQGPHYNAGQSGGKLKQHHNYKENNDGG